jgi:hypothetical protein
MAQVLCILSMPPPPTYQPEEIYEKIFHGRLDQQITVLQRFEEIFEKRMKILAKLNDSNHVIHNSDLLYSDLYSNGYGNE